MKKNVIFLVLDSFIYYKIGNKEYGDSPTPFIDELIKKSILCTNLYSQGPFTESGNKALLTGSDSLNNGGYMHNLNESQDIYLDVFKKSGYETYEFFLPYYMYSNKDFKNIDHQFFTADFLFNSVYQNRLSYFANIRKERQLTNEEYNDIIYQLDLTFEAWDNFLDTKDTKKYKCIERIVKNFDFNDAKNKLNSEKQKYFTNKKAYVDNTLLLGKEHPLYNIPTCNYNDFLDEDFINKNVFRKYKSFLKESNRKQFLYNLRNQKVLKTKLANSIIKSIKNKALDKYFKSFIFALYSSKLMYAFKRNRFYQMLPTIRKCTNVLLEELSTRNKEKPFFVHMHMEELHNRASYFTYDINNNDYITQEFDTYKNYLHHLKKTYKGQLLYDYALLYTDLCIKNLFIGLKDQNLLDNTVIAICADHGCSYDCVPIRDAEMTNNYHSENYHIPLIIFDGASPVQQRIESYHTSKDVLPSIYELCDINIPESINGKAIFNKDNQNTFAISEYMGGGCPDMRLRPIHFMIRNKKYLLAYTVKLFEDFSSGNIKEIYDLQSDPLETKNLAKSNQYDKEEISFLLTQLKERHCEILNSYLKHKKYKNECV